MTEVCPICEKEAERLYPFKTYASDKGESRGCRKCLRKARKKAKNRLKHIKGFSFGK